MGIQLLLEDRTRAALSLYGEAPSVFGAGEMREVARSVVASITGTAEVQTPFIDQP